MINLVKRGTSQKIKRGWILFYAHLGEHYNGRYVLRDYVVVKGILLCVGCVGIVGAKIDISCRGIHSSVVELTSLAILHFYFLRLVNVFVIPNTCVLLLCASMFWTEL